MDRAVANGIALESPHGLGLFRVEQKPLRLDISDEGAMYFWAVKMRCRRKRSGSQNPEEPGIESGPEFLGRAPLQEMKQEDLLDLQCALSINPPSGDV